MSCDELVLGKAELLEFCHKLKIAADGYLNEHDLSLVYKCIGLDASPEMTKELFDELDGDKDGRVSLDELAQMLSSMQNKNSQPYSNTPDNLDNIIPCSLRSSASWSQFSKIDFNNMRMTDKSPFSFLDPQNVGTAKVERVFDLWSQFGLNHEITSLVLKNMGFSTKPFNLINLENLAKALEDEIEHAIEVGLAPSLQAAFLTFRTEIQYLRSLSESIENERDKIRGDLFEAHQRSAQLASEVDEQNSRLEKNTKILLQKLESQHLEQLAELHKKCKEEKESLIKNMNSIEDELIEMKENENKLKGQLIHLKQENYKLESEIGKNLKESNSAIKVKDHTHEDEARFRELECKLDEIEKEKYEQIQRSEERIRKANSEIMQLRDQNDELSSQIELIKERLNVHKLNEYKKKKRRRKKNEFRNLNESTTSSSTCSIFTNSEYADKETIDLNYTEDNEDCESLQTISSDQTQSDSGKFYYNDNNNTITLSGSIGESSTDNIQCPELSSSRPTDKNWKNLESEMDEVKTKVNFLLLQNANLTTQNKELLARLNPQNFSESSTQTSALEKEVNLNFDVDSIQNIPNYINNECVAQKKHIRDSNSQNNSQISNSDVFSGPNTSKLDPKIQNCDKIQIVQESKSGKLNSSETNLSAKSDIDKCTQTEALYENARDFISLDEHNKILAHKNDEIFKKDEEIKKLSVLKEHYESEYEKCEDYWESKLIEQREEYESDRILADEKFNELLAKINEYDELATSSFKLSPIEESESYEEQVNELETENKELREKVESQRKQFEEEVKKVQEEANKKFEKEQELLESQILALTKKCTEYENKICHLAEEERNSTESTESEIVEKLVLKDKINHLEFIIVDQKDKHKQHISYLNKLWKEKEHNYRKTIAESKKSPSPKAPSPHSFQLQNDPKMKIQSVQIDDLWETKNLTQQSSSLPFMTQDSKYGLSNAQNASNPNFSYHFSLSPELSVTPCGTPIKKSWCQVDVNWLNSLKQRVKNSEDQNSLLHQALFHHQQQSDKVLNDLIYQHKGEISNWENLMLASQELARQHSIKYLEQNKKLTQADTLIRDLFLENSKLRAALNSSEKKVVHLENIIKSQHQLERPTLTNFTLNDPIAGNQLHSLPTSSYNYLP